MCLRCTRFRVGRFGFFAVKSLAEFEEVKLMMCTVIDCVLPVFSMNVKFGNLITGEKNGVRVFPLRLMVKGSVKREGRANSRRNLNARLEKNAVAKLQNRVIQGSCGIELVDYPSKHPRENAGTINGSLDVASNGALEGKIDKHSDSVKLRTMKLRQDTKQWGECFLAFNHEEAENMKSVKMLMKAPKAISIQAISPSKFLVLDSSGALHLLCFSNSVHGSESPYHMKQLNRTMKVCKLAVLPGSHVVWISDGQYTVHVIVLPDEESSTNESDSKEMAQAIFASEKIQEIMPLAAGAILILGQGSMFAYAIS